MYKGMDIVFHRGSEIPPQANSVRSA
jgi:hypothetical protein